MRRLSRSLAVLDDPGAVDHDHDHRTKMYKELRRVSSVAYDRRPALVGESMPSDAPTATASLSTYGSGSEGGD